MALSSSASANSFFNSTLSTSSSFNRFASSDFMPPYWASQRAHVDSAIPNWRHTSSTLSPDAKSFWPSASLEMICSGVRRRRFAMTGPFNSTIMAEQFRPHRPWTDLRGSAHRDVVALRFNAT